MAILSAQQAARILKQIGENRYTPKVIESDIGYELESDVDIDLAGGGSYTEEEAEYMTRGRGETGSGYAEHWSELLIPTGTAPIYTPGMEYGISEMLDYIEGIKDEGFLNVERFWKENFLPPLRRAFAEIFDTEGGGQWKETGEWWRFFKENQMDFEYPALKSAPQSSRVDAQGKRLKAGRRTVREYEPLIESQRRYQKTGVAERRLISREIVERRGGTRTLKYLGKYRQSLTSRVNLNKQGNVFQALDAGNWRKGFEYGVNQEWFTQYSLRRYGRDPAFGGKNPEIDYPTKFEDDSVGMFRYWYLRLGEDQEAIQVPITYNEAKRQGKKFLNMTRLSKPMNVPARPVFGFFRRPEHPIIRKFQERVTRNVMKNLGKYLDAGARQQWRSKVRAARRSLSQTSPGSERIRSEPVRRNVDAETHGRQRYDELEQKLLAGTLTDSEAAEYMELEKLYEFGAENESLWDDDDDTYGVSF